jgi:hypothetical protein
MDEKPAAKMNPLDRILSLFVTPVSLMKNISVFPIVWVPLIICVLLSFAAMPWSARMSEIATRQLSNISIERYGVDYFSLTALDTEAVSEAASVISSDILQVSTLISNFVAYPIAAFFAALGLYLLTKMARGKELKLIQYYSMYMHLFILSAIGALVTSIACVTLDTPLDVTSLAAVFMPLGDVSMPMYNFLSAVNIFNIWITALTVIGVKYINHFSNVKAAVIGIAGYAFSVAVTALGSGSVFWLFDTFNTLNFNLTF